MLTSNFEDLHKSLDRLKKKVGLFVYKPEMPVGHVLSATHYIFYHDKKLLEKVKPSKYSPNLVFVDLNSLPIPEELKISGLTDEETRIAYSEYLGILQIKPTTEMVGIFTFSIPLKFCQEYIDKGAPKSIFYPYIKFEDLDGKLFDKNKLYGAEFSQYIGNYEGEEIIREIDANSQFSIKSVDNNFSGPFKGSLVVSREVFLEFQKWFFEVTKYLIKKYGYECKVDAKKVEIKGKYWGTTEQEKIDLKLRRGIAHIQERLIAYYFGRIFSDKDKIRLGQFINSNEKINLYTFYSDSHKDLKDKYFLPSIKDDYNIVARKYFQISQTGIYGSDGFNRAMIDKLDLLIEAVKNNLGKVFLYADVDIQFFGKTKDVILKYIEGKDIVFQMDYPAKETGNDGRGLNFYSTKTSNGPCCAGFFVAKGSEKLLEFFENVKKRCLKNPDIVDQRAINMMIGSSGLKWGFLPGVFFCPGQTKDFGGIWKPGVNLDVPKDILMHHANWTIGIDNKVKQLEFIKEKVGKTHIIIIPYYCQKEVEKYLRTIRIIKFFNKEKKANIQFLLVARFDFPPSKVLEEEFSKIAPTISIQSKTQGRGIVRPDKGVKIEGPTAMFWDAMEYIYKNYKKDSGFALWFESDMYPLCPDWIAKLDAEWENGKYSVMGLFIEGHENVKSHINGGACYSKEFCKIVPHEYLDPTVSWDNLFFKYIYDNNIPYKFINHLIDFRYNTHTFAPPVLKDGVIFHGVKDSSMQEYLEKKYDIVEESTDKEKVLVYQMGKVGSSSIVSSLKKYFDVYHVHGDRDFREKYPDKEYMWEQIKNREKKWTVISGVRDPIEQNISNFFQNIDNKRVPHYYVGTREEVEKKTTEQLIDFFKKHHPATEVLVWLDENLKKFLDIDVYSKPFNKKQGYDFYESDSARLLMIRQENLKTLDPNVIKDFLHINDDEFTIIDENMSSKKWYAEKIKDFRKKIRFGSGLLYMVYGSKYMKQFYTDEEIDNLIEKRLAK